MASLRWAQATERAVGQGGAYTDVINRALRDLLTQSGFDPDDAAALPQVAQLPGSARTVTSLTSYILNNLGQRFDPRDYADGSGDDRTAVQAAITAAGAASPAGYVPISRPFIVSATATDVPGASGKYALLVPSNVTMSWEGNGSITCTTDAATVIAVAGASSASHATGVRLLYPRVIGGDSTNNGLGRGIFFYRADRCVVLGGEISAVRLGVQFDRLSSDGAYNVGNRVIGTVVRNTFGTATGNGTGFFVSGCDGITLRDIHALDVAEHGVYISQNVRRLVLSGIVKPANTTNQNCGVQMFTAEAVPDMDKITLEGVHVRNAKWGILASSGGGGGFITNVQVNGCTAEGCTTNGVIFSGVKDGTIDGVTVTGTTAGNGLEADASVRIKFLGCTSHNNAINGLILVDSTDCEIGGGSYLNNDQAAGGNSGIRLASASTGAKIHDALITDDQVSKTQDYGITIDAAASNADIDNCTLSGNAVGPFATNGATGNRKRNNRGYNPVGASAISVGASPFTYTAGDSPTTVHIFGGTVSSVTKGGVSVASTTNVAVQMEPGQAIIVTYSSGPSMTADIH